MERSQRGQVSYYTNILQYLLIIVSVLLRVMITKAPIGNNDRALLSPDLFEKLGRLCFTQLLELRHRGAFSTVSQTFAAFCRRCVSSNIPALRALPEIWYQASVSYATYVHLLISNRKLSAPYRPKLEL
jgi:hypothetical protein